MSENTLKSLLPRKSTHRGRVAGKDTISSNGEVYISLKHAAVMLNLSEPRVRQIFWEKWAGEEKRVERTIYIPKNLVEMEKAARDSRKEAPSTLSHKRMAKRWRDSAEVVSSLVDSDTTLSAVDRKKMKEILTNYSKQAESLLEELEKEQKGGEK